MSDTTSLKLSDDLKRRIAPLAKAAGKSSHAWMVEAIQSQVELADLRQTFVEDARVAAAQVDAGGPLYAMEDVAAYIKARIRGGSEVVRPPVLTQKTANGRAPDVRLNQKVTKSKR